MLGAGADVDYGMPLVQTLLPDLARWTKEDGQVVSRALKDHLKHLVFSFDKLAADKSGSPLVSLFSGDKDQIEPLERASNRLRRTTGFEQAVELLDKLCSMASQNVLARTTVAALGQALAVKEDMGDAEPLLNPRTLTLSEWPKAYIRTTFGKVLIDGPKFPPEERAALELFYQQYRTTAVPVLHAVLYGQSRSPEDLPLRRVDAMGIPQEQEHRSSTGSVILLFSPVIFWEEIAPCQVEKL